MVGSELCGLHGHALDCMRRFDEMSNEYEDDENADKVHPKSPRGLWPDCFPSLVIALACVGIVLLVVWS